MGMYHADKKDWYTDIFAIPWPDEPETKASLVVEDIGEDEDKIEGETVHLTVFRGTWVYRFQPYHSVDTIFDRIFGSGTGGLHVTLEQAPEEGSGIHCYINGPNQGRTEEEKTALQNLLDKYVADYKRRIRETLVDLDEIIWKDSCDDPSEAFDFLAVETHKDCFDRIAAIVSARHGKKVIYPAQGDTALLWATGSVHPLQSLQNSYQRMVRDAVRGLDGDKATAKEAEEMGKYFYFTADVPKLMGLPKDAPPDIATQLEDMESTFSKLEREIPTLPVETSVKHLEKLNDALWKIRHSFNAKDDDESKKAAKKVPTLAAAEKNLKGFKKLVAGAKTSDKAAEELEKIRNKLSRVHRDLSMAYGGMCSIQNFHTIEPFYLFRLLVKFQIQSESAIAASERTQISSSLTGLLHNSAHVGWLFDWLRDKLVELDKELQKACPEKGPTSKQWPGGEPAVVFFLKGGRAAKYLQKLEKKGENDWDTNIVINPNLKSGDWYRNFLAVHNTVLTFLQRAKREFCVLVYQSNAYDGLVKGIAAVDKDEREAREKKRSKADTTLEDGSIGFLFEELSDDDLRLREEATNQLAALDKADTLRAQIAGSSLEEMETENCKAELIDIGIPRRDTVEAFEQWFNVCPRILKCADGIPIPGHLYYIGEYVMMIREAFMDKSISMPKTPKRVIRLLEVLKMDSTELTKFIDEEKGHIPSSLDGSKNAVDALDKLSLKRMLTILLKQFSEAYELAEDPGLAKCFDTVFCKELPNRGSKAKYPASLTKAIDAEKGYKDVAENKELADAIGFAQWMAEEFGTHLKEERAKFVIEQLKWLVHFIKAIYTASFFAAGEDLEVQFGVSGAFAAYLHAKYMSFERMEELEPVKRADLKIFCKPGSDPATVLELIQPLIDQYLKDISTERPHFHLEKGAPGTVFLQWPEEKKFAGSISYKPIVIKVSAEVCAEDWPQLAFIKGLPVLGLRELIWEYKRHAGHVEETFTQRGLKTAIDALVDMLTRFENPNAGKPWDLSVKAPVLGGTPPEDEDNAPPSGDEVIVSKEVPNLEFVAQKKNNWCWAASSLMMRRFYLDDRATLEDVVSEAFPELEDAQNALRLSRLKPEGKVEGRLLTWDQIKTLIDADKPFIIAKNEHYWVCYGYEERGAAKTLLYWNPLPKETGAKKRMSYAQYESFIRGGGATAQGFTIEPRKVLVPLLIDSATYAKNANSLILNPAKPKLRVQSAELHVRHARNKLGEIGAIIRRVALNKLPDRIEWDMTVDSKEWETEVTRMNVIVEVEATLALDEKREVPSGNGQLRINITIEKPN